MTLNPWRRQEPLDLAELARLLPAPGEPDLPPERRLLIEGQLMDEIDRRRTNSRAWLRRPAWLAVPAVLAVATAATLVATGGEPTGSPRLVTCYSEADPASEARVDTFFGTSPGQPDPGDVRSWNSAVSTCALLWQWNWIRPGEIEAPSPGTPHLAYRGNPGHGNIPLLDACVRADGQAAVFPGGPGTCRDLGLPSLAGTAED
ncbi:hypothetical protein OG625_12460 [Streptomyces sp. NBC_01351]|uniref:hypothetical protein n=1 Tax=Streptomyces sp. NBC_01351 TaxID=2903833 RepID=UPI002E357744|nr:hypothetical protein [Streptomyces sp. NBC_01351]